MFVAVLLVCFLVIVIEFATSLATFATAFCWLCSICIWSTIGFIVFSVIKTIIIERGDVVVLAECTLEAIYSGAKLIGMMILLVGCMRVAIGITNLIEPISLPQITLKEIFFPWTR